MPYIVESVKSAIRDALRSLEGEEITCVNFVWSHGHISINKKGGVYEINDDCIDERPIAPDKRLQINNLINHFQSKGYDAKWIENFIYLLLNTTRPVYIVRKDEVIHIPFEFDQKLLNASIDLLEAAKAFTDLYEQAGE